MTPLLRFTNTSFHYADSSILANVSFTLEQGSCTALIGPNGSGKTTLLRLASGTLTTDYGTIELEGRSPATLPHRQRAGLVALVPQQLEVPFDFTVEQIVEQGRTPYLGWLRGPSESDRWAVDRALDLTDTKKLRHRVFNELSGGERQRVKIGLGLAQQAKLLLLDEPTQNLDVGRQAELIDLVHRLRMEGITILASIHDLHLIPGCFETVLLLKPDRSLMSGTPEELLTSDMIASAFHLPSGRHSFSPPVPFMKVAV